MRIRQYFLIIKRHTFQIRRETTVQGQVHRMEEHERPVIDNETVTLSKVLKANLKYTKRFSVAVGYFFISGFADIMNHFDKIEKSDDPSHVIRLMISPTTNRKTAEAMLVANEEFDTVVDNAVAYEDQQEQYKKASEEIRHTLEYMSQNDSEKDAVLKLVEMIRNKKLEIRVYTRTQLHAKAYIFELENAPYSKIGIVGSSNMSISGIKEHTELNLRTNSPHDADELLQWFERHWNDDSCLPFTKEVANILEGSWAVNDTIPEDVYGKAVLHEHESKFEDLIDDHAIDPDTAEGDIGNLLPFQKIAVSDAIGRLDRYGGIIIADVVGMGKTYVGTAIMKYFRDTERTKPLVICPPHLIDMWKKFMNQNGIHGKAVSRHKAGRDGFLDPYDHCDVVLIDESHNFRNSNTSSYRGLLSFLEEKADGFKVILLSATPISNTVTDIKNQLKLFPPSGLENLPVPGSGNLDEYFKGVEKDGVLTADGKEKVRELIKPILIRRTRSQILAKYAEYDKDKKSHYMTNSSGEPQYFAKRKLRNPKEYDVDKVYDNNYEGILDAIQGLRMARYAPGKYVLEQFKETNPYRDLISTGKPLVGIARTLLLKRMESSIKAFSVSIKHYQKGYSQFRDLLKKKKIPVGPEFGDEIYKSLDEDDNDKFLATVEDIESRYDFKAFDTQLWLKDLNHDIGEFAKIQGLLGMRDFSHKDDKIHKLSTLIKSHDEKILIFTESAVTAKYIYEYVVDKFKNRRIEQIDSKDRQKRKNECVRRFDPENNGRQAGQHDEIDVLISTDVLSEGVNLQAARVVINYDFHWNPVRLIQRVGRIDRLGTKHAVIDIFNFMPTSKIDEKLGLEEKVKNKIETIRKIVGHDQQILSPTEIIDDVSTLSIYDPSSRKDDESVLSADIGIIDFEETESEKHANYIMDDDNLERKYKEMQFGIRGVAGKGRLLIACEAEEEIQFSGSKKRTKPFRRHYEVTPDGNIRQIFATSFFRQIGKNYKIDGGTPDSEYNKMVAMAWCEFNVHVKREVGKRKKLSYQIHFLDELKRIMETMPEKENEIMELRTFLEINMRPNVQPYMSLRRLRQKIDADSDSNDVTVLDGLKRIRNKYENIPFERVIKKPRILYSMEVGSVSS